MNPWADPALTGRWKKGSAQRRMRESEGDTGSSSGRIRAGPLGGHGSWGGVEVGACSQVYQFRKSWVTSKGSFFRESGLVNFISLLVGGQVIKFQLFGV